MNFDAAAIALLLFATPGVLFVLGLNLGSRVRLIATQQWLQLLALFVLPSTILHFGAALWLDAMQQGVRTSQVLSLVFRGSAYEGMGPAQLNQLAAELAVASGAGFLLGIVGVKVLVWGWVNNSMLHGPTYPFVRGFERRFVRASVLSNVTWNGAYVIYDGVVSDLCMTSDGRLAWISLMYPARAVLQIEPRDGESPPSTAVPRDVSFLMDDRLDLEDVEADGELPEDILTLEGEDVLNYYLVRLDVSSDRGLKAVLAERWRSGFLPRWLRVFAVVTACMLTSGTRG